MIEFLFQITNIDQGIHTGMKNAGTTTLKHITGNSYQSLSIMLCDEGTIRELNLTYRGIDSVTDVLSFPNAYKLPGSGSDYIGDIAISLPTAEEQANAAGHVLKDELALLVVHGVLHLFGYDHDTLKNKSKMWKEQTLILAKLGIIFDRFTGDDEFEEK